MRKRPCRICGRWYAPNPRVKDRQKSCGESLCKREWHRRKCAEWNKKNSEYFKWNYLEGKLEGVHESDQGSDALQPRIGALSALKSRFNTGLPRGKVQEVIGIEHLVILEYLAQLLMRRFQEVIKAQVSVITRQMG